MMRLLFFSALFSMLLLACHSDQQDAPSLSQSPYFPLQWDGQSLLESNIVDTFQLDISAEAWKKLQTKRNEALKRGLLVTSSDDEVKARMYDGEKWVSIKIRLKGDWTDHLKGNKWSFKIKTKKTQAIRGMQTFSLQSPLTRDFLSEWVLHQFMDAEDILNTKYHFVQLMVNGRSVGLYAVEEHFDRHLPESRWRREGPLLKFNEEGFWQTKEHQLKTNFDITWFRPVFESAEVEAFKPNRTWKDESLRTGYLHGRGQLMRLQHTGDVYQFDLDRWMRCFAIQDLTGGYHTQRWHNWRFFVNPSNGLIEPVVYDGFTDQGEYHWFNRPFLGHKSKDGIDTVYWREELLNYKLLEAGQEKYIEHLERMSDSLYLNQFFDNIQPAVDFWTQEIQKEFPKYQFDLNRFQEKARQIRTNLDPSKKTNRDYQYVFNDFNPDSCTVVFPEVSLKAYTRSKSEESLELELFNFHCRSISVIGWAAKKDEGLNLLSSPVYLEAYNRRKVPNSVSTGLPADAKRLFFRVNDSPDRQLHEVKIKKWPASYDFLQESVEGSDTIVALSQNHIAIKGMHDARVFSRLQAGDTLTISRNSGVLAKLPLQLKGKPNLPIVIFGEAGNQGIHLIGDESNPDFEMEHVQFHLLGTHQSKSIQGTGGLTVYSGDVKMSHCTFSNNQSEDALNLIRCTVDLNTIHFEQIMSDALDLDFCTGSIQGITSQETKNDAIDIANGNIKVSNCRISKSLDKGITIGEAAQVSLKNIQIDQCKVGIAVKDGSALSIEEKIEIDQCQYGMALFNKKPVYDLAKATLKKRPEITNTPTPYLLDKDQLVILPKGLVHFNKGHKNKMEAKDLEGSAVKLNIDSIFYQEQ